MLTIIISTSVTLFVVPLISQYSEDIKNLYSERKVKRIRTFCSTTVVFMSILWILATMYGLFGYTAYTEWELVGESPLVNYSKEEEYLVTYQKIRQKGEETLIEKETESFSLSDVSTVMDPNCKKPVFQVYERKGKASVWNMALGSEQKKYVIKIQKDLEE